MNDAHCGACDHDCGGGACEESECQPFILVRGQANIHGLTLDEMNAYFTTSSFNDGPNDVVASVSKAGGALTIFSDMEQAAQHVIVVGERVYWTTWDVGAVRSAPLDQSDGARTEWTGGAAFGIRARGEQVVFGRYDDGLSLFSSAAASPPPVTSLLELLPGEAVALFDLDSANEDVVFTVANFGNGVRRYSPSPNPQVSILTTADFNTWGMAQDASYYYYSDQGSGANSGKLSRISKSSGSVQVMATGLSRPRGLAVDADFAYVAEFGAVRRVSLVEVNDSFASSLIAPAQEATMIAVDEKFIYWTNYGQLGGTLSKLAKPL
jgi:hypothetical protein